MLLEKQKFAIIQDLMDHAKAHKLNALDVQTDLDSVTRWLTTQRDQNPHGGTLSALHEAVLLPDESRRYKDLCWAIVMRICQWNSNRTTMIRFLKDFLAEFNTLLAGLDPVLATGPARVPLFKLVQLHLAQLDTKKSTKTSKADAEIAELEKLYGVESDDEEGGDQ